MGLYKATNAARSKRIIALDYLRGFFIVVIIIDHLWRWPNVFSIISGRGELWASAAEGFVIISGLLVGYIRGYKNRHQPLASISKKLVGRGLMLYLWMVITTMALVAVSWLLEFKGSMAHIPIDAGDWTTLIASIVRFDYVHTLTHFLYLYAIFLLFAPLAIWCLRRGLAWVVAAMSVMIWGIGILQGIEWMQWQLLFFVPAIGGFYLDALFKAYHQLSLPVRKIIRYGTISIMIVTVLLSAWTILPNEPGAYTSTLFSREPVTAATIVIAFIWFIGLLSLFQLLLPWLRRSLGWLLLPFGERSLTAYILHTIPLVICQLFFAQTTSILVNSLLTAACILGTWLLIKIPGINHVIPR
jgi:hypothetical protein